MNHFLEGFADELLKVAGPWGAPDGASPAVPRPMGVVRPPSTGVPGAAAPKPPNAMGAARNELMGAIPTQKMESPAKTQPQGWRPSPGYRPSNAGDSSPTPPKPAAGGKGGGRADPGVPWETAPQRLQRVVGEQNYNRGFAANNSRPAPTSTTSAASYRLNPQEMAAQKQRAVDRDTSTREKKRLQQIEYNKPENKARRWSDLNRANANSALAGGGQRRGDTASQKLR